MGKSKIIHYEGIGSILFEKSQRAKRINISIRPAEGVRVAIPYTVSFRKAEKIVNTKLDWIKKHIKKINKMEFEHNNSLKINSEIIDKQKAKNILINRLNELAQKYNFNYNKVSIRNQKTRWGSCSTKNNINLNIKLVKLPQELLDYVIIHELVHLKIKNHSKEYWSALHNIVGDAKKLDAELKKYTLSFL